MEQVKVCFLGNWNIGAQILKTLILEKSINIETVITTVKENDFYSKLVYDLANEHKINVINTADIDWRKYLEENVFDLLISVSFGYILKKTYYETSKYGAINLHQSILPLFRGPDPILNAIINNENKIGFSIHYIDEGIDTGNIIYQALWPLSPSDTLETINKKIIIFSKNVFWDAIKEFVIKDHSPGIIQNGTFSNAPKVKNIGWNTTVQMIQDNFNEK